MTSDDESVVIRRISTDGFVAPIKRPEPGPAPQQQWLEIDRLIVDPAYQRPIRSQGRVNIARIAAGFDWRKFAPVVVAPVEGGLYAIVDGQHRTTAAALVGITSVPCHIIQADRGQQARAFAAINGVVTPISGGALWHAKVAAGDEGALKLSQALACAGVRITHYPVPARNMKPGDSNAVRMLDRCLRTYGREVLITALNCITQTGTGASEGHPGMVRGALVVALCEVLAPARYWRDAGEALLAAVDGIGLCHIWDEEASQRSGRGVDTMEVRLARRIRAHLTLMLGTPAMPKMAKGAA